VGVVDTSSDPQTLSKTICSLFKEGQIFPSYLFYMGGWEGGRSRGGRQEGRMREGGKLTF